MDNWVALSERPPTEADGDAQKCVLVWHELSGCMIYQVTNIEHNSFLTHWMRLPEGPEGTQRVRAETGFGGGKYEPGNGAAERDHEEVPGVQRRDAKRGDAMPGEGMRAVSVPAVSDGESDLIRPPAAVTFPRGEGFGASDRRVRGAGGDDVSLLDYPHKKKKAIHFKSGGESGNIYAILAKVSAFMLKQKRIPEFNELRDRVYASGSYESALGILREEVDLIDDDGRY